MQASHADDPAIEFSDHNGLAAGVGELRDARRQLVHLLRLTQLGQQWRHRERVLSRRSSDLQRHSGGAYPPSGLVRPAERPANPRHAADEVGRSTGGHSARRTWPGWLYRRRSILDTPHICRGWLIAAGSSVRWPGVVWWHHVPRGKDSAAPTGEDRARSAGQQAPARLPATVCLAGRRPALRVRVS